MLVNRRNLALGLGLVVVLGLIAFQELRPLPTIGPTSLLAASRRLGPASPALPWPATGSSAVAVSGLGTLATHGPQTSLPMASTAKVMTAMLVLQGHPLALATKGPLITVTAADEALYNSDLSQGQSAFPVKAGEQLSEYQALQAMLVPSGNNVADLLADWDSGTTAVFVDKMNTRAAGLGLKHTHFADASGFSPASVSSPQDLIQLAEAAMNDPVFAEIVKQPEATLPIKGRVFNANGDLGQDGIIGVKTGSSPQAGAVFVFAADARADDQPARIFGAIMGLSTLADAFSAATALIEAVTPALHYRSILSGDQVVGEYAAPWGDRATVFASQDVNWVVFDGMVLHQRPDMRSTTAPLPSGSSVGVLTLQAGDQRTQIPLKTTDAIFEPDVFWRLTRLGPGGIF